MEQLINWNLIHQSPENWTHHLHSKQSPDRPIGHEVLICNSQYDTTELPQTLLTSTMALIILAWSNCIHLGISTQIQLVLCVFHTRHDGGIGFWLSLCIFLSFFFLMCGYFILGHHVWQITYYVCINGPMDANRYGACVMIWSLCFISTYLMNWAMTGHKWW